MSTIQGLTPPGPSAPTAHVAGVARVGERPALVLAAALGVLAFVVWSGLAVAEYDTFHNHNSRDFATYANVLWNTAHGQPYRTHLLRLNVSHLAEHVALILLPLAPLYALIQDPRALALLQQAALALAGLPIFLLARRKLGAWAALGVLACYYLAPQLSDAILFLGFYPVALSTLPLTFGAYLMLSGRSRLGAALALCAPLIEETSGLALFGLGAMLILRRQLRWGTLLCGVAVAYLGLVTLVVMPAFHLEETQPDVGNRTAGKFELLLADPLGAGVERLETRGPGMARWFLLPNAGMPLLSPTALVPILPNAGVLLLEDRGEAEFPSQRVVPAIPLVWIATVEGLALLGGGRRLRAGLLLVGLCTLATFLSDSQLPLGGQYDPTYTGADGATTALERVLALVPAGVPVGATRDTAVHLANRADVWLFPLKYSRATKPDLRGPDWWIVNFNDPEALRAIRESNDSPLEEAPFYAIWLPDPGVLVATKTPPRPARAAEAEFGGRLRLEGYEARRGPDGLFVRLAWRLGAPAQKALERHVRLVGTDGQEIREVTGPASNDYYPTTRWKPRQEVVEDLNLALSPDELARVDRVEVRWREAESGRPLLLADGAAALSLVVEQQGGLRTAWR